MKKEQIRTDVAIIGGGSLGLPLAYELLLGGNTVALFESGTKLANGPSTRNGRLLHTSYHVAAITDSEAAFKVGQRVRGGFKKVHDFAPEALNGSTQTFVVFHSAEDKSQALARWDAGDYSYSHVSPAAFRTANPLMHDPDIIGAVTVPDRMIDSRVYYGKLSREIRKRGGVIITNTDLVEATPTSNTATVRVGGKDYEVTANQFVVTAGYGAGDVYKNITGQELGQRYWTSHFLTTPRFTDTTIVTFGESRLFAGSYGDITMLEPNRASEEVTIPDFAVLPHKEAELREAAQQLFPTVDFSEGIVHACHTVDTPLRDVGYYAVDEKILPVGEIFTFAWPGKMTSAPVVAEELSGTLRNKLGNGSSELHLPSSLRLQIPSVADYPYTHAR